MEGMVKRVLLLIFMQALLVTSLVIADTDDHEGLVPETVIGNWVGFDEETGQQHRFTIDSRSIDSFVIDKVYSYWIQGSGHHYVFEGKRDGDQAIIQISLVNGVMTMVHQEAKYTLINDSTSASISMMYPIYMIGRTHNEGLDEDLTTLYYEEDKIIVYNQIGGWKLEIRPKYQTLGEDFLTTYFRADAIWIENEQDFAQAPKVDCSMKRNLDGTYKLTIDDRSFIFREYYAEGPGPLFESTFKEPNQAHGYWANVDETDTYHSLYLANGVAFIRRFDGRTDVLEIEKRYNPDILNANYYVDQGHGLVKDKVYVTSVVVNDEDRLTLDLGGLKTFKRISEGELKDRWYRDMTYYSPEDRLTAPINPLEVNLIWDRDAFNFDVPPQVIDGRTMVPLRALFEKFGYDVVWDSETATAVCTNARQTIYVKIDSKVITIEDLLTGNQYSITNDVASQIVNQRTLVPLRLISELVGLGVKWHGETRSVYLSGEVLEAVDFSREGIELVEYGKKKMPSLLGDILQVSDTSISLSLNSAVYDSQATHVRITGKGMDKKVVLDDIKESLVEFSDLRPDTAYDLVIEDTSGSIYERLPFKTFSSSEDYGTHYFIDYRASETGRVKVTIIGHYKDANDLSFSHLSGHKPDNYIHLLEETLDVTCDGGYSYLPETSKLAMTFNKRSGYYRISYEADKTYQEDTQNHGAQGIMTESYFLASGEQFLILPPYGNQLGHVHFSILSPSDWVNEVGLETTAFKNLFTSDDVDFMKASPYMGYDPQAFTVTEKNIYGTDVVAMVEKGLGQASVDYIMVTFEDLCDIWGGSAAEDRYLVMVLDDERPIWAGENDRGTGFSQYFGLGMFNHQVFHRWNGWQYMMAWDRFGPYDDGLWIEGVNDFYVNKLVEKNLDSNKNYMAGYYQRYLEDLEAGKDLPILTKERENRDAVYYKGALITYKLNEYIEEKTSGAYSFDHVLKHFWQEWIQEKNVANYDQLVDYLNTIVPGGIEDWWQKYVIDNERLYLD